MKKLILYNHLGEKVKELEVFVDGSDFTYEFVTPTCFWLGKILLVDKELEVEFVPIEEHPTEVEEAEEMREEIGSSEEMKEITEALDELQEIEEAKSEPKTISDKSARKSRSRKAKQPKSPKNVPQDKVGSGASKRSTKPGDSKTA